MLNEADLKQLQRLGLTERESKVYLALVNLGPILPIEIQTITSIQRSKIYEALHNLLQLGFIIERPEHKRKVYEAIRPDEVIQHLLLQRGREMDECQLIGMQLGQRLTTLFDTAHRGQSAQDYFTFLQNPTQISRVWDELRANAETEVLTFVKAPYIYANGGNDPDVNNKPEMDSLSRGVRFRAIYEADELLRREDWLRKQVMPCVEAGEEARVHPELAIKLTVFDRRISYFGFIDEAFPQRITAILIENRGIAMSFAASFEFYWQASTPIREFLKSHPGAEHTNTISERGEKGPDESVDLPGSKQ
jgi:HTH-type transcriptional regulator, sugar sensing transcriptional regulator